MRLTLSDNTLFLTYATVYIAHDARFILAHWPRFCGLLFLAVEVTNAEYQGFLMEHGNDCYVDDYDFWVPGTIPASTSIRPAGDGPSSPSCRRQTTAQDGHDSAAERAEPHPASPEFLDRLTTRPPARSSLTATKRSIYP